MAEHLTGGMGPTSEDDALRFYPLLAEVSPEDWESGAKYDIGGKTDVPVWAAKPTADGGNAQLVISKAQEIRQIRMDRPHVVILGAGASLAACPTGDNNGRFLPVMNNLIERLSLQPMFERAGIEYRNRNFEELYSELCTEPAFAGIRTELERGIYNYFALLEIPHSPNPYDSLVLSLRKKDIIATFNWDPLLVQAYRRNARDFELPTLLFLHGNVAIGYCFCAGPPSVGVNGGQCRTCRESLAPTPLLYPIARKDYTSNPFIATQWTKLTLAMQEAFMLTIFGYGAPDSDVAAIELFKCAWGASDQRAMEQVEIINVLPEADLREKWDPFIHSHHYEVHSDFSASWLANHPRRSGEAFINQYVEGEFIEANPIPPAKSVEELWAFFGKLTSHEKSGEIERYEKPN